MKKKTKRIAVIFGSFDCNSPDLAETIPFWHLSFFKWQCFYSVAINLVGAGAFDGPLPESDGWHGAS